LKIIIKSRTKKSDGMDIINIRKKMKIAKINDSEFSRRTKIPDSTLSQYLNGDIKCISPRDRVRIGCVLNIDSRKWFGRHTDGKQCTCYDMDRQPYSNITTKVRLENALIDWIVDRRDDLSGRQVTEVITLLEHVLWGGYY